MMSEPPFPLATARSGLPSRLKSLTATKIDEAPTGKLVAVPKPPAPLPNRTETSLVLKFDTAKSGLPSRLKSPIATERGLFPTPKFVAAANAAPPQGEPLQVLSKTVALLVVATRSGLPSRLKSPTATD